MSVTKLGGKILQFAICILLANLYKLLINKEQSFPQHLQF